MLPADRMSGPLSAIVQGVNVLRFVRTCSRVAHNVRHDPLAYSSGIVTQIAVGSNVTLRLVSQIALIARTTIELYDAQMSLNRAWNDFRTITDHIPIALIKHACSKPTNEQKLSQKIVKALPDSLAKTYIKIQELSRLIFAFSKALWCYLAAWDALYCACNLTTLDRFAANAEVFSNIKTVYTRVSNNQKELEQFSSTTKLFLGIAKVKTTWEELMFSLNNEGFKAGVCVVSDKPENVMTAVYSGIQRAGHHLIRGFTDFRFTVKRPDNIHKQPILQGYTHDNDSGSGKTCKTNSGAEPGRFYKTA